jgi:hypothetical protein
MISSVGATLVVALVNDCPVSFGMLFRLGFPFHFYGRFVILGDHKVAPTISKLQGDVILTPLNCLLFPLLAKVLWLILHYSSPKIKTYGNTG